MIITNNTIATIEEKRKHVRYLISNIVYSAVNEIEEKEKKQDELDLKSNKVKMIKAQYFINSSHASYEISRAVRNNSLIEFLVNKLSEDELNQLRALSDVTEVSITDES